MKLNNANTLRTTTAELLMNFFKDREEDCGMIASNAFNFPVVTEDGEEGWIEITVKVPKEKKTKSMTDTAGASNTRSNRERKPKRKRKQKKQKKRRLKRIKKEERKRRNNPPFLF
jgi:hypothetical protein